MRFIFNKKYLLLTLFVFSNVFAQESVNLFLDQSKTSTYDQNRAIKDWNFFVYITANNDLNYFSQANLNQMARVGTTNNINIIVQIDTLGKKEISRILVENGRLNVIEKVVNKPEAIMGTSDSLFKFVEWGLKNFQARKLALVLWDHGSGIEDPSIWGKLWQKEANKIFKLNTQTGFWEIDVEYLKAKGIAFNDQFQTYLTNQDLRDSLNKISQKLLGGKKINILGMDACNMNMLEMGSQIRESVDIMVGSQETEPGTGWNYYYALQPFTTGTLSPEDFASHMVRAYGIEYQYSYVSYTQSALKLAAHNLLENNINDVAICLLALMSGPDKNIILSQIKTIRNTPSLSTVFANKNYIDMRHLYVSLKDKFTKISPNIKDTNILQGLIILLDQGISLIDSHVIENVTSSALSKAGGLSIYFPARQIHSSYYKTIFARNNNWIKFLEKYLKDGKNRI